MMKQRTQFERFSLFQDLRTTHLISHWGANVRGRCSSHGEGGGGTSPQPLHGKAASSCSMGESGKPVDVSAMIMMLYGQQQQQQQQQRSMQFHRTANVDGTTLT